jgi:hypothetical protein
LYNIAAITESASRITNIIVERLMAAETSPRQEGSRQERCNGTAGTELWDLSLHTVSTLGASSSPRLTLIHALHNKLKHDLGRLKAAAKSYMGCLLSSLKKLRFYSDSLREF